MNDCDLAATEDERVELILAVAEGRLADVGAIVKHLALWVFQALNAHGSRPRSLAGFTNGLLWHVRLSRLQP